MSGSPMSFSWRIRLMGIGLAILLGISGQANAQKIDTTAIDALPGEVQLAVYGAIATIRGFDTASLELAVTVQPQAVAGLHEPTFQYQGFSVQRIGIDAYSQRNDDPSGRRLLAHFVLQDVFARRVILDVLLHYRAAATGITIEAGMARVVAPIQPDTRFFVVPRALLPQPLLGNLTHAELVKLIVENDQLVSPSGDPHQPGEYAVMALVLDRLPDGDAVIMQPAGAPFSTEVIDFAGFRVAIGRGNFALADLGSSITMELAHLPALRQGESPELRRLVATEKPLMTAVAPPQAPPAAEDDIEARLRKLDALRDAGLVSIFEYEVKRQEILDSL
ncbi:MAG: hypothetical protein QGF53_13140 [Alphaproteobacteria bacterium]|nr:hypothetical protein [Alphaproteobacteria bacterium]